MVRRSGESTNRNGRHKALVTALLLGTATVGFVGGISQRAIAQSSTKTAFSIPAGPLNRALAIFGRQSGLQITYNPAIAANKRTNGATGQMDHAQAIGQILQGSGLSYSFPNAKTVTIAGRATDAASQGVPIDASGSTLLNTITVTGGQDISPTDAPYRTAAPTSYISKENIDHFRGSSPADIFRGTPGVMSGDARNGGAVDVNIRGMQGFGRVATTVDGAENGVTVYQGYQGLSNRTYIDPDFIGGVEITKGSNVASRGIAGNVAIRTINADDIIKPGNSWGIRIKGEYGGNSATPHAGAKGGYQWPYWPSADPVAIPSKDGMGRPSLFTPTSGSGSVVAAIKDENYDFLAGYAYRKRGNYYAGKHGPAADHVNLGPKNICNTYGYCQYWPNYIDNGGLTNYRAGEEVLNTQSLSESYLAKATLRFDGGHTLQLGYTGYRGEAGDLLASRFTGDRGQPTQQEQTSGTRLDTGTMRYSWKPDDNDLIDLKANLWHDFGGTDRVDFEGTDISTGSRSTSFEFGGGVVAKMTDKVSVFATADYTTNLGGDRRRVLEVTWALEQFQEKYVRFSVRNCAKKRDRAVQRFRETVNHSSVDGFLLPVPRGEGVRRTDEGQRQPLKVRPTRYPPGKSAKEDLAQRLFEKGRQPLPMPLSARLVIDAMVLDAPAMADADIVLDDVVDLRHS